MDHINNLIEEIHIHISRMVEAGASQTPFMRACAKVDLWQKIEIAVRAKGSRARQTRNALLPIQQLPTEVALHLFNAVLMPVKRRQYYDTLKDISKVCHRWRHTVHHTPALWSRIYGSTPHQIVDQALERSATHSLDVWFSSRGRVNRIDLQDLVQRLSPHIGRCQSVALTYFGEWDASHGLTQLVHPAAPRLERLLLEDHRWVTNLSGTDLFGGQASMLKEVGVVGITCDWGGAVFQGLSVISLSRVFFPTIDSLLETLDQSRCLSRLNLSFIVFPDNSATTPVRHIDLPLLNSISLAFDDMQNTEILLDHVNAPICSHLCLFLLDGPDIGGHAKDLAAKWLARRQAPIPTSKSTAFALANSKITLSAADGQEALSLTFSYYSGDERTARILNGVNRVAKELLNAKEASLKLDDRAFALLEHSGIVDELRQLPPVTVIEIGDPCSDGEGRYWGYPRHFNLPPFPSLRLFRTFHQPMECIFTILKGIFTTPITTVGDRIVYVEIHGSREPEDDWLAYIATQMKEIVGESCRSSFVTTPRFEKSED
ncbi:hypothetical protein M407DRAFT_23354 [Tulasnella calospora MUT 4182]|uniref:Uncharacterized protein n=1 Tax=Tulasnella calospora MUT 4182 TaxID=1051891 RepID=A0A0C3QAS3_9AGAM|nr:hypothetical protein M407DRAFT_23354 [Tulasnella calospora MUT 4182]